MLNQLLRLMAVLSISLPFNLHAVESKKCSEENLTRLVSMYSTLASNFSFELIRKDGVVTGSKDPSTLKADYLAEREFLAVKNGDTTRKAYEGIKKIQTKHPECIFGERYK
ncbi:MAG: hypothetical protein ACXVCY_15985 [Pseudobdellovibrionaceae bacterium]